jgi:hypothetical protein
MLADRVSLLDQVAQPGFGAAVLTSYNVYFPFFEEVVLRRLHAAGCAHVVLFCHARMCAEAFASEATQPRLAGRSYVLVPVRQQTAFHPKLLLQLGKGKGCLCVGSHNVTLSGFGHNDEITNVVAFKKEGRSAPTAAFRDAVSFLRQYLPALPSVREAFEHALAAAPWLTTPAVVDERARFLGTRLDGAPLWDQVAPSLPRDARRALVVGPFFDDQLALVTTLRRHLERAEMVIAVDPAMSQLDEQLASRLPVVRFVNASRRPPGRAAKKPHAVEGSPLVHAKLLWLETTEGEVLVSGSANPSAPAFLERGQTANVEAVLVRRETGLAASLGLEALWDAPPLSSADWQQIAEQRLAWGTTATRAPGTRVLLAEPSGVGFLVNDRLAPECAITLRDEHGSPLGTGELIESGPPARIHVEPTLIDLTDRLDLIEPGRQAIAVVHRPEAMRERGSSDTRATLKQVLGSIYDDPEQLVPLVELAYKTLFQSDIQLRVAEQTALSGASATATDGEQASAAEGGTQLASLAVTAQGPRKTRRKRSIAQGDVLAFIETVASHLAEGRPQPGAGTSSEEEEASEPEEEPEDPPPPPVEAAPEKLASLCRQKSKKICERMVAQLSPKLPDGSRSARRCVALLRCVLSVVRLLDVLQRDPRWRHRELLLIDDAPVRAMFASVMWHVMKPDSPLFAQAIEENGEEEFSEITPVLADLGWLAWHLDIDVRKAEQKGGRRGVLEERWLPIQHLAWLAPHLASDADALVLWEVAVRKSPRRGEDAAAWLRDTKSWLEHMYLAQAHPESLATLGRAAGPGDLVVLGEKASPRVLITLDVDEGKRARFVDAAAPEKTRVFQLTHVRMAASRAEDATAHRAAG